MSTAAIVAPHVRDLDPLARSLEAWLADRLPGATDIAVTHLDYPRGAGMSHETILFDAAWSEGGARRTQGYVVRIKPTAHLVFPDDLFVEQYKLMRAVHDHGAVRVARPMWLEEDPSLLGAPFFIMEKKTGRVPVSMPSYGKTGWVYDATPDQRRRLWESGVRQLAAIQSVPREGLGFLKDALGPEEGLAHEWDKYRRFIAWVEEDRPWPVLRAGMDRLAAMWPKNQPAGLVWGDARLGNMMFDADFQVVAVMDWEQPSLGGALHDLAWWITLSELHHAANAERGWLEGMGTREETIALWHEVTGIPTDDIAWYEDFVRLKMSCCSIRTAGSNGMTMPDEAWLAKRLKVA
jgi:aminoglycoside phosphotransferase (APT) family kinase protein